MTGEVRFGLIHGTDAEQALEHIKTLDSDGDGVPDVDDRAPHDPKVSATYPSRQQPVNSWDKQVMHAVTKDKGFTFRDMVGDGPSEGYMVSVAKHNEVKVPVRDLTSAHIADYMSTHQQELKDPNNYLGGWVYKGNVYLDISRHTHDRGEAMKMAKANSQLGIYDIGKGETLMTEHEEQPQQAAPQRAAYVRADPKGDLMGFVNALRAEAGLPPAEDSPEKRTAALRLVEPK